MDARGPGRRSQILRDGPVRVFEINGEMDPAACDGPARAERTPS